MIENIDEFRHRYRGTVVGKRISRGNITPINIDDVSPSGILYYHNVESSHRKQVPINELSLVVDFPTLGLLNYQDRVIYISRRAGRVYKRGIQADRLHVYNVPSIACKGVFTTSRPRAGSRDVLTCIYNPKYVSMQVALSHVYRGKALAKAITTCYAIAAVPNSCHAAIFYKHYLIGHIYEGGDIHLLPHYVEKLTTLQKLLEVPNV